MKGLLIFLAGGAVGGGVAWYFLKKYYEEQANETIESAISSLQQNTAKEMGDEAKAEKAAANRELEHTEDRASYSKEGIKEFLDTNKTNYQKGTVETAETVAPTDDDPGDIRLISLDEYEENLSYEKTTLVYYAVPGILCTEYGEEVDPHTYIGDEALNHFGDEEAEIVYVRNEKHGHDYEVIRDLRTEVV